MSAKFVRALYFRCTSKNDVHDDLIVGDVYACWEESDGTVRVALSESNEYYFERGDRDLENLFEPATEEEFEASISKAMKSMDGMRERQSQFMRELQTFNTALISSGDMQPDAGAAGQLMARNSAGQIRNQAHGLNRKAQSLTALVQEKKELLEAKLGQKMALAMASLADMQAVVEKLTEVVMTVQLYLGRDEEIVCLRDGKPCAAEVPLCIRQNVLYMDEEVALDHHSIDIDDIEKFDAWLTSNPKHLHQVMPELKGVVVLQVRRNDKEYEVKNLAEALAAAERNSNNTRSYFLIRNGERLHRIHAEIWVGERLLPRQNEVDHFFYEKADPFSRKKTTLAHDPVPLRAGSKEFLEAMDHADAVRRHYMRLMLILQGLIDRTQLFMPYVEGKRPNLLDPNTYDGRVNFLRDVEATLTDGRPEFSDWLKEVNAGLQHGHRIVGSFPVSYRRDRDESRVHPPGADGVNDDDVHVVIEKGRNMRFTFKRTDTVWRHGWGETSGPAKTAGSYKIYRSDQFFVCIDNAKIEDMEYYIADRRHRKDYERMIPALKRAVAFIKKQAEEEKPFRELLLNKLTEAAPSAPCTPEILDRLIHWWKTKTREHRALLADDGKAYRMIVQRHIAQAASPATEENTTAMLEAIARMPNAIFAFHIGGTEYGVLRSLECDAFFVIEETWRVTRGTPHIVGTKANVLPQKAYYETFPQIFTTCKWTARPAILTPASFLSPEHRPAMVEYAKANPPQDNKKCQLASVYMDVTEKGTRFHGVWFNFEEGKERFGGKRDKKAKLSILDHYQDPNSDDRRIFWKGTKPPTFESGWTGSTATYTRDYKLKKGWEDKDCVPLFVDDAVIARVERELDVAKVHDTRARYLSAWVWRCEQSAQAAFEKGWRAKQFAKYTQEQGDPEFFEDHLKTLPKHENPKSSFVSDVIERAILGGLTPKAIAHLTIAELLEQFPFKKVKREFGHETPEPGTPEALEMLASTEWHPPFISSKETDDDE